MTGPATWTFAEQADPRRMRALEPYLVRLRGWNDGPYAGAAQIRVGSRAVRVETWERNLLRAAAEADDTGRADLAALLAQGLALVTKSLVDLERIATAGGTRAVDLFALQADLMLDAAIGMALLGELQAAVDALVRGGRVDEARRLTDFRNRLHRLVSEVKRTISESERRRAEALSGNLGAAGALGRLEAEIDARVERERAEQEKEAPRRLSWRPRVRRRRRPGEAPRIVVPSRTSVLAAAVAAAACAWLALVAAPSAVGRARAPRAATVLRTGLVVDVRAVAPSVYVTVDAAAWGALAEGERLRAVHDVVRGVPPEDWAGAFLRTDDGRPVARWLRGRGIELLRPAEVPEPVAFPDGAFVGPRVEGAAAPETPAPAPAEPASPPADALR